MAIAIVGGRFDPIHIGHLIVAQDILEILKVNKVVFLLSHNPPHKPVFSSFEDRYNMIKLSIENFEKFEVWDIERKLNLEKSYTYLILIEILKFVKEEIFLVIGSDEFENFKNWYRYEDILKIVKLAVVQRPENPYSYSSDIVDRVIMIKNRIIQVSSSEIRKRIRKNMEFRFLVPYRVYEYIVEKKLYVH
ncbi:MAG: nicotinate (nicotinamide) nucleotide adenylyltransferase [candidate division WOR-3 bacterium]|nr:nicotinate (nicotinamide) nucleotide adenylyltransferase [candidate division WOR-3 bacterium]MCX7948401.1 nicotinate (nicotinamide) nucleotide adenylyltransferase [candidate division WOR-3 bacterium]MDW8150387.1 nicotinate (nicotinamide) nucleotide adenylyltransferase [candidate division WOR-3 bacterium]